MAGTGRPGVEPLSEQPKQEVDAQADPAAHVEGEGPAWNHSIYMAGLASG